MCISRSNRRRRRHEDTCSTISGVDAVRRAHVARLRREGRFAAGDLVSRPSARVEWKGGAMNGFNPQQLVARGVFDSVEELDRVMCELDDARREPRIIACAWREGFDFTVPRVRSGAGAAATSPFGNGYAAPVEASAGVVNTSRRSPELLPADASVLCSVPVLADYSDKASPRRRTEEARGSTRVQGRRPERVSPTLAAEHSLCPWCALERAMSGQGTAARTGFVSVARCARHSAESRCRL